VTPIKEEALSMKNKRILIVSAAFYPDNTPRAFRSTELAKEFARMGHYVEVLTKKRAFDYTVFETEFSCRIFDKIEVKKYSANIFQRKRGYLRRIIDRILYQAFMYPDILISFAIRKALLQSFCGYDLILSVAKPHSVHLGCAMALKRNKLLATKWIADCGDPFTLCKTDAYKFIFYFKCIERWMFKLTDFISIPVESAKGAYYREFYPKLRIIPQGFSFETIRIYTGSVVNPVPTFAYAGAFYNKTRNPQRLLDYLTMIPDDFKFIIYTHSVDVVESYQFKLQTRLEIRKPIPREKLLFELSKMDFLLNIENMHKEQVPSKIIDYALTKRPILSINPDNPDIDKIIQFIHGDYSGALVFDNINDYNIKRIVNQFLDLLV